MDGAGRGRRRPGSPKQEVEGWKANPPLPSNFFEQPAIGGFETEHSCNNAKAEALTGKSGAGGAGECAGGGGGANRTFATEPQIPPLPSKFFGGK